MRFFLIVAALAVFAAPSCWGFFHITPHQHVTVSVRFGKVLEGAMTYPGLSFVNILTTKSFDLFVEEQVDSVEHVECGTSDGISLHFPKVDIHNRLPPERAEAVFMRWGEFYDQLTIFKDVRFFVGQICAALTAEEVYLTKFNEMDERLQELLEKSQIDRKSGLEILKVKFYKPYAKNSKILEEFQKRAEAAAAEKALHAKASEIHQRNANKLLEREGEMRLDQAKNEARIAREIADQEGLAKKHIVQLKMEEEDARLKAVMSTLRAEAEANATRIRAKAEADAVIMQAKANEALLTEAYLRLKETESRYSNAKLIVGDKLPKNMWLNTPSAQDTPVRRVEQTLDSH